MQTATFCSGKDETLRTTRACTPTPRLEQVRKVLRSVEAAIVCHIATFFDIAEVAFLPTSLENDAAQFNYEEEPFTKSKLTVVQHFTKTAVCSADIRDVLNEVYLWFRTDVVPLLKQHSRDPKRPRSRLLSPAIDYLGALILARVLCGQWVAAVKWESGFTEAALAAARSGDMEPVRAELTVRSVETAVCDAIQKRAEEMDIPLPVQTWFTAVIIPATKDVEIEWVKLRLAEHENSLYTLNDADLSHVLDAVQPRLSI